LRKIFVQNYEKRGKVAKDKSSKGAEVEKL